MRTGLSTNEKVQAVDRRITWMEEVLAQNKGHKSLQQRRHPSEGDTSSGIWKVPGQEQEVNLEIRRWIGKLPISI